LNGSQLLSIFNIVNIEYHDKISKLLDFSFLSIHNKRIKDIKADQMFTGRLSVLKDPELKRRVIAMVDYLSQ
jgi:hypothetical protein